MDLLAVDMQVEDNGFMTPSDLDRATRFAIYQHLLDTGKAPGVSDVARRIDAEPDQVGEAFDRLAAQHVVVLQPGTRDLWMAMPFSAVPTGFQVVTHRGTWWANCAWDALGASAMLAAPATIATTCADCGDPVEVRTTGEALASGAGVVHFAVPAAQWWDDIGFT